MPRRRSSSAPPAHTVTIPIAPRQPRLCWHGMDRSEPAPPAPTEPIEVLEWIEPAPPTHSVPSSESALPEPRAHNRLILARDNLLALRALLDEREPDTGAPRYRGRVDLVYIDPPFMVNSDFYAAPRGFAAEDAPALAYRDTWAGGLDEFLSMLRERLILLRELLADTGSIYVHLDRRASHYAKVLLDEIFGYDCFRNEITWRRANAHSDPHRFGAITDAILFYARSSAAQVRPYFRDVYVPYSAEYVRTHFRSTEPETGRRYRLVPLDAPRHGDGGNLVYEWRGRWPAPTRTWACKRETMEELEAQGRIAYTSRGTPTLRRYLDDSPGLVAQSLWDDIPPVNPMARERLGYPTQKPLALLERVLRASCPPGGLVLDCFAGSGTTCEAAERLGCRWIGIDSSSVAVATARGRLLRLSGQPVAREPPPVRYRTCDQCSAVSRTQPVDRSVSPLHVRPFVIETCGLSAPEPLHIELAVTVSGRTVTVDLAMAGQGNSASASTKHLREIDAWAIDWDHGSHGRSAQPERTVQSAIKERRDSRGSKDPAGTSRVIFRPSWHSVRSPGGKESLTLRASFTYSASGEYTIAARALDRHGHAGDARVSLRIK